MANWVFNGRIGFVGSVADALVAENIGFRKSDCNESIIMNPEWAA